MFKTIGVLFRLFPDFRGKRRLARILLRDAIRNAQNIWVEGKNGCQFLLPNLRENLTVDVFINGMYEPETHHFLLKRLPETGIFLDLGANIGTISIPLCKARPQARCIAVEASPRVYSYLRQNIEKNKLGQQIECINNALFDKDGESLSFFSPDDNFGKGSLAPVFTQEATQVKTVTVDAQLKRMGIHHVDLIKIDIEGFEYFAFKGGAELLAAATGPDILFEFIDWAEEHAKLEKGSAQVLLQSYGYCIYSLSNDGSLKALSEIQKQGSGMLFATKKLISDITVKRHAV